LKPIIGQNSINQLQFHQRKKSVNREEGCPNWFSCYC